MELNKIYCGENLEIMRSLPNNSIDLIATDPPFFSQRDYGDFDDRWDNLENYLEFIVERVKEMYRLLKDSGSLYLQCDTSASHYLKVELDKIFGQEHFKNEIIWCYSVHGGKPKKAFPKKSDRILFYSKTNNHTFNTIYSII